MKTEWIEEDFKFINKLACLLAHPVLLLLFVSEPYIVQPAWTCVSSTGVIWYFQISFFFNKNIINAWFIRKFQINLNNL